MVNADVINALEYGAFDMPRCFISYAREDINFVKTELEGLMSALDIEPWFDRESIRSTEYWEKSIVNGLTSSDWFVLVMSESSASADWVQNELAWAMENLQGYIIPILISDCDLDRFHLGLRRIQYLDYKSDPTNARNRLITILRKTSRRSKALEGSWSGTVFQEPTQKLPEAHSYPINAKFDVMNDIIRGEFSTDITGTNQENNYQFTVTGSFIWERFVQLTYESNSKNIIQFGSFLAEISADASQITGRYVGYGAQSESIVYGTVELKRLQI